MSRLTLRYEYLSEHVLLPYKDEKRIESPRGGEIVYIGTAVLRDFRKDVNVAKFDVYYMRDWKAEDYWINYNKNVCDEQLENADAAASEFLNNAHNSPDTMVPIFDCHTIAVFAKAGYYFVDEANRKSLRHFNIKWHKNEIKRVHYNSCRGFLDTNTDYRSVYEVEYENGILANVTKLS